jgi:LacI family transcriptional regulator
MEKHFRRLLHSGGPTAWVCANDMTAVLALAFLKRNGVAVPERVSVMGFDNTLASWQLGITSYDFAYDRMGHLAARAVINPSLVGRRFGHHAAIEGSIIPRGSVGRAP